MTMEPAGSRAAPAARHSQGRPRVSAVSVVWAVSPLFTLGLGTWAAFLYGAVRRRSWWLGGAAAVYALLAVTWLIADSPAHPGPLAAGLGATGAIGCMIGGFANALAVRGRVFGPAQPPAVDRLLAAEHEVQRRRKLRAEARALLARDPGMARELGIGRPDLRRDFDDGGLVDVNHAPAAVLATLPGLTPELAAKAVELRASRGPFVSADELSLALALPPDAVPALADLTIYPS
jgi:hypothetical protein